MECCQFSGLNYATEHKTIVLVPGERFVGGAVSEQSRLVAFDLIKEYDGRWRRPHVDVWLLVAE